MEKSFTVKRTQNIIFTEEEAKDIDDAREFIKDATGIEVSPNKFIKTAVKRNIKKNKGE